MEKTLEQQIDELNKELELAHQEYTKRFNDAPNGMDYNEFDEYMSNSSRNISEISRKLRLIQIPVFNVLSDYGDVMSIDEFIEEVNSGNFIDYDGFGLYVKDDKESDISIHPSDVKHGMVRKDFNKIIWFNR
jgi:hypothetical protein